jgi:hypothetical protein
MVCNGTEKRHQDIRLNRPTGTIISKSCDRSSLEIRPYVSRIGHSVRLRVYYRIMYKFTVKFELKTKEIKNLGKWEKSIIMYERK